MLNLTSQVSNLRPMGHNLAREAFLYGPQQSIFALLMDSCHYNITIRFAGGQQSSKNTRTTFDNDFCRSCHCKTDGILPRTLDRKLFKISLSNFSQFSQRSYAFSLRSLLMTYTLGCLPISIYFCSWHWQQQPSGLVRYASRVGYWLIQPAVSLKIAHIGRTNK